MEKKVALAQTIESDWSANLPTPSGTSSTTGSHDTYQKILQDTDPTKKQADINQYATDLADEFADNYGGSAGDHQTELDLALTYALTVAGVTRNQLDEATSVANAQLPPSNSGVGFAKGK